MQSLRCTWTSSLNQYADGPQTVGLQTCHKAIYEEVFIPAVEPQNTVHLFTYLTAL